MFKPFIILLICSFQTFGQATQQSTSAKNALYLELLGSAGYLYNITYDRMIVQQNKHHIALGIGGQFYPASDFSADNLLSCSPQLNYFIGNKHYFETGIGMYYEYYSTDFGISTRFGYRYQNPNGGLLHKAAITPILTNTVSILGDGYRILPSGGIAIGYSF